MAISREQQVKTRLICPETRNLKSETSRGWSASRLPLVDQALNASGLCNATQ